MTLECLPDEISLLLLRFLSVQDRCRLTCVSKHFYRISNDDALWRRRAEVVDAPGPSSRVCSSSLMYRGCIYIYGGHNPAPGSNFITDVKNELFVFNIETSKWTMIPTQYNFPFRTEHSAVLYDDRMYIIGGYSGLGGYRMDPFYFDLRTPLEERWEPVVLETRGEAPSPRSAMSAVVWQHYVYVFGGWDGEVTMDDFYRLDLKKLKWKRVRSKGERPPPRRSHNAFVWRDAMYILLGYDGTQNCEPHLYRFDFETKKWEIVPVEGQPPPGRSRAKCVLYNNTVAIFGGWDRVNHFEDWWELSLVHRKWRSVPVQFPSSGIGQHTAEVHQNKVFVFGGYHANKQMSSSDLWIYYLGHLGREYGEA